MKKEHKLPNVCKRNIFKMNEGIDSDDPRKTCNCKECIKLRKRRDSIYDKNKIKKEKIHKILFNIGVVSGILLVWSGIYLLFSFIGWSFKPMNWWLIHSGIGRFIIAMFVAIEILFTYDTIKTKLK